MSYSGGSAVDTLIAGGGGYNEDVAATVGSAGALIFGSGGDTISSTAGGPLTDLEFGTAAITLGGVANNLIAINNGTINPAASSGSNTIFDNGSASIVGGSGPTAIVVGTQNSTLTAGSGSNLFVISALARTSRQFLINNFNDAQDFIDLVGYASSAPAAAYKSEVTTSTSFGPDVTVTLLDGTKIVFQTPANLASFSFQ
jgi:hypothetical protein